MKKIILSVAALGLALFTANGQSQTTPSPKADTTTEDSSRQLRKELAWQQRLYRKAVERSTMITPDKMIDRLWSVDDQWVDKKDTLVLVVMPLTKDDVARWTGAPTKQTPASYEEALWVSLSPELSMVMHNNPLLDSLTSSMRIKQILGLQPQQEYVYMVQFWVPVSKLVRPTPDPNVHNHFSTVSFPEQVDPVHKQWIEAMQQTPAAKRPRIWTQLGYTYDWGNPYNEIGVSEFVVKPGTTIRIDQLATIWYWYSQQVDLTAEDVK